MLKSLEGLIKPENLWFSGICREYKACNFIKKEAIKQVVSCEFSETFKNTNLFYKISPVAASEHYYPFLYF